MKIGDKYTGIDTGRIYVVKYKDANVVLLSSECEKYCFLVSLKSNVSCRANFSLAYFSELTTFGDLPVGTKFMKSGIKYIKCTVDGKARGLCLKNYNTGIFSNSERVEIIKESDSPQL